MSALNFDKDEQPFLTVIKGGKNYKVFPVELLCRIGEALPKGKGGRRGKREITEREALQAIRAASGIAKLTPDEAVRLRQAAEEMLLRSEAAKKKWLLPPGSSGSTPD